MMLDQLARDGVRSFKKWFHQRNASLSPAKRPGRQNARRAFFLIVGRRALAGTVT
jgi:hypothetical protein